MEKMDIEKGNTTGISRRDLLQTGAKIGVLAFFAPGFLINVRRATAAEFSTNIWRISGVPERVDPSQVDRANLGRGFVNTLYGGSEQMLAEPGVLKVGWDFPQDQFKQAGEHIYRYDGGNADHLNTREEFRNIQEGGFSMFNGNAMVIEVSGNGSARFRLEIGGPEGNHNIVVIRGLYSDGSTPADRNRIAQITGHTPGAVRWDMYPRGGFVSQGHFEQIAENALKNNPNCGAEGCNTVRAYFLDLNTGAFSTIARPGLSKPWEEQGSNWYR